MFTVNTFRDVMKLTVQTVFHTFDSVWENQCSFTFIEVCARRKRRTAVSSLWIVLTCYFFIAGVFFIWGDVMSILKQGLHNWRIMKTCVAVYYGEQYYRRRKKWWVGVVVFKKKRKRKDNRSAFISSYFLHLYTLLEVCVLVRAIQKWEHLKQNGTKWVSSPAVVCSLKGKKYSGNVAPATWFR